MNEQNVQKTEGVSTVQAGSPYKGVDPVAPLDGVSIQPTMIQFDYRVYQDEISLWRKSVANAEELYRKLRQEVADYYNAWQKSQSEIAEQRTTAIKVENALSHAGIKLVRLRNHTGYRVVILKKPKVPKPITRYKKK